MIIQTRERIKKWGTCSPLLIPQEVLIARSHRFSRFLFFRRSKRVSLIFQLVNIREL